MSDSEKRRKDRKELHELLRAIEHAKNEDIARRAISIADYWLIKVENQAKHIQDLEARNNKQPIITPERKRGRWETIEQQPYFRKHYKRICCSECKRRSEGDIKWNFCPNCGADMRGEQDEY